MIRKALRRANRSYVFTLVLALLFSAGYVGSTYAYFDGTVTDTATYAGGTIGLPTLIGTPVPVGYGASFGWTPATIGLNGQAIYQFDNGTNSSCTGVTYAPLTTGLPTTLATTTVTGTSTSNGDYVCYEIRSTHGGPIGTTSVVYTITTGGGTTYVATTVTLPTTTYVTTTGPFATTTVATPTTVSQTNTGTGWYQVTDFAGVRVGLIPLGATETDGGKTGTLANGDLMTITYNQAVSVAATPITVMGCASATAGQGSILFGAGSCGGTPSIGQITGLTMTGSTRTYTSSAVTASSSTAVITLGGGGNGSNSNTPISGTGSFTPSGGAGIQSSVGAASVCTCTTISPGGGF